MLEHQLIGSGLSTVSVFVILWSQSIVSIFLVDVEHFMVPVLSKMAAADSCMSQLEAARVSNTFGVTELISRWIQSAAWKGCYESGAHAGAWGNRSSVHSTHRDSVFCTVLWSPESRSILVFIHLSELMVLCDHVCRCIRHVLLALVHFLRLFQVMTMRVPWYEYSWSVQRCSWLIKSQYSHHTVAPLPFPLFRFCVGSKKG